MDQTRLKDIAKELGLSTNTVSKALNGKPGVNEETRRKIEQTALRMHYTPNEMARSLRGYTPMFIGIIVDDSASPYFAEVIKGIEDESATLGYYTLLFNAGMNREREQRALEMLQRVRVSGIVFHPGNLDGETISTLKRLTMPVVLLDVLPNDLSCDSVNNDDRYGMKMLTSLVLSRGFERIAFLNLREESPPAVNRLAGVYDALDEAGKSRDFIQVYPNASKNAYSLAYSLMTKPNRPDCLLCANDTTAAMAMEAVLDCGLSIPGDVSVTGYDDVSYARLLRVPLTTVSQPKKDTGRVAMQLLHARIKGTGPDEPVRFMEKPEIKIRKSLL